MARPKKTIKPKYPPCPTLRDWLYQASPTMAKQLAYLAQTSITMFRQWVTGRRGVSADTAGRLELASGEMALRDVNAPPPLLRGDLCEACRNCNYYQTARRYADEIEILKALQTRRSVEELDALDIPDSPNDDALDALDALDSSPDTPSVI